MSITHDDLAAEVGRFLGFGRDPSTWSDVQAADVDSAVQSGVRQFYYPPAVGRDPVGHQWSFLKPVATLTTVADQGDYDLPADFGGVSGKLSYDAGDNWWWSIPVVGEGRIRELRQRQNDFTGSGWRPRYAAVRPAAGDGSAPQSFELLLWPTPQTVYALTYRYLVLPAPLGATREYPYGGAAHGETILASCLAIAQDRIEDAGRSVQRRLFLERLAASVARDRAAHTPEFFGYNADSSDTRTSDRPMRWRTRRVTYHGA